MRVIDTNDVRHICLVCFNRCSTKELREHHHCCDSGHGCEAKLLEIIEWEKKTFGESLMEDLTKEL